jgi:putative signal transducing protein
VGRVHIGTCSGPAEVALVRAAFQAHDIPVLINAEHHASILGGLGGVFVPLHIYVAEEDAEQGAALLADLRDHDRAEDATDGDDAIPAEADAGHDSGPLDVTAARIEARRRIGIMLVLAMCVMFSFAYWADRPQIGGIVLAICFGLMIWTVRRSAKPRVSVPQARVRR